MTNMRERGMQHQYLVAAFAALRSSNDHRESLFWQEQQLSCAGSPP